MLLHNEPLSGVALVESIFEPEDFPDTRLFQRVKAMANGMLDLVCEERDERLPKKKRAEQRGASRLIANERVKLEPLVERIEQRSIQVLQGLDRVLVAHDTIEFDKHGRHEPADAGPLRSSQARGYLVHHATAIDPNNDARIAILSLRAWTRPFPQGKPRPEGKVRVRRTWKNEDNKWGWGIEQVHRVAQKHGFSGHLRHLADHEGSSYATLVRCKRKKRDYIARTRVDRCILESKQLLFRYLRRQPVLSEWSITTEESPKVAARGTSRPRRQAQMQLRLARVTLKATCNYKGRSYRKGLAVWAVYAYEPNAPTGCEPLEWMLLSVEPVRTRQEAEQVVHDYHRRWGAEDIAKVFKSGCHTELKVVPNLAAFQRLLTVAWPVAVHIARWTYCARTEPQKRAADHVDEEVLVALKQACRFYKLSLPRRSWTLKDVVLRLAQMGGYEPRHDRPPGFLVIWRGWRIFSNFFDHLYFFQTHLQLTAPNGRSHAIPKSRSPTNEGNS